MPRQRHLLLAVAFVPLASGVVAGNPVETGWVTEVHVGPPAGMGSAGKRPPIPHALDGIASYYWQGQRTASGEAFDKRAMTAAHPTLPFGTLVTITNLRNGKKTVVRINDRGPFKPGRVIDVSEAAAEVLGMQARGLAPVKLDILATAEGR